MNSNLPVAARTKRRPTSTLTRLEDYREQTDLRRVAFHVFSGTLVHFMGFGAGRWHDHVRHTVDVNLGPIVIVHPRLLR